MKMQFYAIWAYFGHIEFLCKIGEPRRSGGGGHHGGVVGVVGRAVGGQQHEAIYIFRI